jgi:hypothetical protein
MSMFYAARGSRGTFLPFLLFLFASEVAGRRTSRTRLTAITLVAVATVVFISQVRSTSFGLFNFFTSLQQGSSQVTSLEPLLGVSSVGANTSVFWISSQTSPDNTLPQMWALLSPLPSYFVHQDIGATSLFPYLGITSTNSNAPFPLVGELFFYFGWWGMAAGVISGFAIGFIYHFCLGTRNIKNLASLVWPLFYVACVMGVIMSMHSGIRTVSRLPIWAFAWYLAFSGASKIVSTLIPSRPSDASPPGFPAERR